MGNQTYGLGNVLTGAARAVRNIKADNRADETYQLGLEDAAYSRERRNLTDQRTDEQHELDQESYQTAKQAKNAMRQIGLTGDASGLVGLYKSIGVDVDIEQIKGGKYTISVMDKATGKQRVDTKTKDEIGMLASGFSNPDSIIKFKAEAAKARQEHLYNKEIHGLDNANDLAIANVKTSGKGSDGEKAKLKLDKERAQFHRKAAEANYSRLDGDMMSFSGKEDFVARNAALADAYEVNGVADRNGSQRDALRDLMKYGKMADEKARQDLSEGADIGDLSEEEWMTNRSKQYLENIVDNRLQQISGSQAVQQNSGASPEQATHTTGDELRDVLKKNHPDASDDQIDRTVKSKFPDWQSSSAVVDTNAAPIAQGGLELAQGHDVKSNLDQPDTGLGTTMLDMASGDEKQSPDQVALDIAAKEDEKVIDFSELGLETQEERNNKIAEQEQAKRAEYDKKEAPVKKLAKKYYNRHQKKEAIDYVNRKIAAGIVPENKEKVLLALQEKSRLSAKVRRKLEKVAEKMGLLDKEGGL